jgi:hypothetical protein
MKSDKLKIFCTSFVDKYNLQIWKTWIDMALLFHYQDSWRAFLKTLSAFLLRPLLLKDVQLLPATYTGTYKSFTHYIDILVQKKVTSH